MRYVPKDGWKAGRYTFIADYLPWANGDGMEHRNSTVLTSPAAIAAARRPLAEKGAHEVFHAHAKPLLDHPAMHLLHLVD